MKNNQFLVLPELLKYFGLNSTTLDTARKKREITIDLPPGPPEFDWRSHGAVTEVLDQGFYCSCCWAFSAVGAIESHNYIRNGVLKKFSEQNLIDCNRNPATGNWGCDVSFCYCIYMVDFASNDLSGWFYGSKLCICER